MNSDSLTTRSDLTWLASCYVAGELSADEAAAFESRLANDDAACEAVAFVMETQLAIAAAFAGEDSTKLVVPARESAPNRWAGLGITALAGSALAGVALMLSLQGEEGSRFARRSSEERIVAAWARGEAVRNDCEDEDLILAASEDADLDPPDWMLAALTASNFKDQLPDEKHEVREN